MTKIYFKTFINLILIGLFLAGCAPLGKKKSKVFKHDTPLIKTDVKQLGKAELEKMLEMGPVPVDRANRRINAANGTRIREHGVKQIKFRTREGRRQDWKMLVTDVKKALMSVATACDGGSGGERHVLFTKHGGTIINVGEMQGSYAVGETGKVKGAGELTAFDRTGNTYGMEAWVYVGQHDKASEGVVRPVVALCLWSWSMRHLILRENVDHLLATV